MHKLMTFDCHCRQTEILIFDQFDTNSQHQTTASHHHINNPRKSIREVEAHMTYVYLYEDRQSSNESQLVRKKIGNFFQKISVSNLRNGNNSYMYQKLDTALNCVTLRLLGQISNC